MCTNKIYALKYEDFDEWQKGEQLFNETITS